MLRKDYSPFLPLEKGEEYITSVVLALFFSLILPALVPGCLDQSALFFSSLLTGRDQASWSFADRHEPRYHTLGS